MTSSHPWRRQSANRFCSSPLQCPLALSAGFVRVLSRPPTLPPVVSSVCRFRSRVPPHRRGECPNPMPKPLRLSSRQSSAQTDVPSSLAVWQAPIAAASGLRARLSPRRGKPRRKCGTPRAMPLALSVPLRSPSPLPYRPRPSKSARRSLPCCVRGSLWSCSSLSASAWSC